MAAIKKGAGKDKRPSSRALRGRMPVKRSINLMLVDENRISPAKAIPAIILIIALAAVFSKFLVVDRLVSMNSSSSRVTSLRNSLEQATAALDKYEGVEDDYAHLTYAGMTQEELDRVDRVKILELVSTILPEGDAVKSWSVNSNILTVDITGDTLQSLNELARKIEESPIVDTCVIATAKKDDQKTLNAVSNMNNSASQTLAGALESRRQAVESGLVDFVISTTVNMMQPLIRDQVEARFTIYLRKPPEEEETETAEAGDEAETGADAEATEDSVAPARAEAKKPIRSTGSQLSVQETNVGEEVSIP